MYVWNRPGARRLHRHDPLAHLVERVYNDPGRGTETDHLADTAGGDSSWRPAVDILESDVDFLAVLDVPGLAKNEIEVAVEDNVLTVSGERKPPAEEHATLRRVERAYGTFRRSFTLPKGVEAARIAARLEDGVLTLTLPKAEVVQSRKISVG